MPKEVVANGKTFTFDDNVSVDDISEAIDDYFASNTIPTKEVENKTTPLQKKSSIESGNGGEDSGTPVQPSTGLGKNTKTKFSDFDPYAGTEINTDATRVDRVDVSQKVASEAEGIKAKSKAEAKSLDLLKSAASPEYLFKNTVNNLAKGLVKTVSGVPKSIAIAAHHLDPTEDRKLEDMPTYKAGKWMDETADDLFPIDKNLKNDFLTGKLPETMGNASGYMLGGVAGGGATVALLGGTQNMSDEYHAALEKTGDEDLAFKTSLRAFAIGTLEAAPVASFFNKLDKATGGMVNKQLKSGTFGEISKRLQSIENTKIGGTALGGLEEMAQESTSQILNNLNAQQSYDATRKLTDGLGESSGMGLGFGLVMNGFRKALEFKRDNASTPEEKGKIEEAIVLTKPKEEQDQTDISKGFNPDKAAEIINKSVDEHIKETDVTNQPIDQAISEHPNLAGDHEQPASPTIQEPSLPDTAQGNNNELPTTGSSDTEGANIVTDDNQAEPTVAKAIIEINGKTYEGKNHAEAILKAKAEGQDILQVDRKGQGQFMLSDGTIISREDANKRFGADNAERLIEQDDVSKQANKDYRKITDEASPLSETDQNELQVGNHVKKGGKWYRENKDGNMEPVLDLTKPIGEIKPVERKVSDNPEVENIKKRIEELDQVDDKPINQKERDRIRNLERPHAISQVRGYFLDGGKIKWEASKGSKGVKAETGLGNTEKNNLIGVQSKDGSTIDQLAHTLWENQHSEGQYDTEEFKNAIIDVLVSENRKDWFRNQRNDTDTDYLDNKHYTDLEKSQLLDKLSQLESEENHLLTENKQRYANERRVNSAAGSERQGADSQTQGNSSTDEQSEATTIIRENGDKSKTDAALVELDGLPLTHVKGVGMGQNQLKGSYISTEKTGNRYATEANPALPVTAKVKTPFVTTVNTFFKIQKAAIQQYFGRESIEDLSDSEIDLLAEILTSDFYNEGYDSVYFPEGEFQEGEIIIFDRKNLNFPSEQSAPKVESKKETPPPADPPKQEVTKEPAKKIKSVYENAITRADIPEETKQYAKDNLFYNEFTEIEANAIADALIEEAGSIEEALSLFNDDAQMPSSVKVKLYIKGIEETTAAYYKATENSDKREILERQADLMTQLELFARDGGRLIQAVKQLYKIIPEAIVIKKKRDLKKLNDAVSEVNVSDADLGAINEQLAAEVAKSVELQQEIDRLQKQINNTKKTDKKEKGRKLMSEGLDELASIMGAKKNFVPDYESKDVKRAIKKVFKGLAIELELAGDALVEKVRERLMSIGFAEDGLDEALENNRPDKINVGAIVKSALVKLGEKSIGKDKAKQNALHQAVLAEVKELDIPEDRKKILADKIVKSLKEKAQKVVENHLKKKYTKAENARSIEKSARKLAEDINNGVLNKDDLKAGFAAALGKIDINDPTITDRLNKLATDIANAGTDITRFKAELAMSEYMDVIGKKSKIGKKLMGLAYGNMLLSLGSPLTNVAFGLQVVAKEYIYNTVALLKSGATGKTAQYQKSLAIYSAMASAATGKGSVLARDILRTGNALEQAAVSPQSDALINNQKEIKSTLAWALDKYVKGMSLAFRNLRAGDAYLSTIVQNKAEFESVYDTAIAAENVKAAESLLYIKKSPKEIARETLKLFNGQIKSETQFGKDAAAEIEKSQGLTEPLMVEKEGKNVYNPFYQDKKYNDIKRLHALAAYELQEKARGIAEDKKEEITQGRMEQMLMGEPQGDAGVLYQSLQAGLKDMPIKKLTLLPFLKVALNATNQLVERSPIGTAVYLPKYLIAAATQGKSNPQMSSGTLSRNNSIKNKGLDPYLNDKAKSRILRRQLLGMATTAAIYGLTQIEFDEEDENGKKTGKKVPLVRITGRGYHSWSENNNLRYADPNFEEYSMVLYNPITKNKTNIKYKTSVIAGPLIVLGILDDYQRYGKQSEEETASIGLKAFMIFSAYAEFIGEASSMKGMADVIKGLQDLGNDINESSKIGKWEEAAYTFMAKKVPSLLPIPLRASKELNQITDIILDKDAKQATKWYEHAMRDVPMLNEMLHYKFDHLGDPVEKVFDVPMIFNDQYEKRDIYAISQEYGYSFKFMKERILTVPFKDDIPLSPTESRDLELLCAQKLKSLLYTKNEKTKETGIENILKSVERDKTKTQEERNKLYKKYMDGRVKVARSVIKENFKLKK